MPELPEVELVSTHLRTLTQGRRIAMAKLIREKLAPAHTPKDFARSLSGSVILSVHRRGKFILFQLDNGLTLVVHLRMSGRFMLLSPDAGEPKFTHAVFYLENEDRLVFTDQRHFGFMKIVNTGGVGSAPEIAKLAPEPFSEEFSREYIFGVLRQSKRPVKELLLDQTKVCGVGNIYASEALFRAGIRPHTPSGKISAARADKLHFSIRQVLHDSIELSKGVPLDPENIGGNFYGDDSDAIWQVYGREGEPCAACQSIIKRLKQGGRSTFFCPRCQR